MRALRAWTLLALALSCESSAGREARALSAALERMDRAAPAEREGALRGLKEVACADESVCAAKEACVTAHDVTTRALALKAEVEARLSDIQAGRLAAGSPEAQALPLKVDDAERLLKEGKAAMDACLDRMARVRARHRT